MKKERIIKIIFIIYSVLIFIFVTVKFTGSIDAIVLRFNSIKRRREYGIATYNIIPFHAIKGQLKYIKTNWGIKNFFGNITVFIPLGFLLPITFNKLNKWWKVFIAAFIYIALIECFQYVTMLGIFDVDDIILNFFGSIIGFIIYLSAADFCSRQKKPAAENNSRQSK